MVPKNFGSRKILCSKNLGLKNENKNEFRVKNVDQKNCIKKIFGSREPILQVWLILDWYPLRYFIKFKLGKMLDGQILHGQMLMGQMIPRQLTTHADGLIVKTQPKLNLTQLN